jgi:predicted amidohydrolase YtcJ
MNLPVVFSSDGMPAGPLFGMRGATHHANPRERIAPAEAFYRYTRAAADVFGAWDEPAESDDADDRPADGQIRAGARADLVVLSGNPLLADPDRLRVEMTVAQGVEVYRAPAPTHSKPAR